MESGSPKQTPVNAEQRKTLSMDSTESDKQLDEIRQRFVKLPFDTKITLVNWCKELLNNERRGSVAFNLEEDYLNSIVRKQSMLQSIMHIAPMLPKYVIPCIVISTISGALLIPFFKMVTCGSPYLLTSWKALATILVALPMMIHEIHKYGEGVNKLFSAKNILMILLCQIFGVLQMFCQLFAMKITYSSHVLLFSGMASVVLFFWKIIKRLPVGNLEIAGIIIAIAGSVIISQGGSSGVGDYTPQQILMGDLISFLGSVFGAFNLQILAPLLQFYQIGIYIVISNGCVFAIAIFSIITSGFSMTYGFDPLTGFWGFLHPSYFLSVLTFHRNILISILGIGILGTYGYLITLLIALKFLSPMIVALTCLIQPIIAQIFATALGLEGMPGIL